MRKWFISCALLCATSMTAQQTNDPVIMKINGKPVLRSEFEYSFNKNGSVEGAVEQKTVDEYVDMFINYKLKVAAAVDAGLDKQPSYDKEFRQYRDMQLTPYLVDSFFIDSVAQSIYNRTVEQLKGQDLLHVSHILLRVKQTDGDAVKNAAKIKADSIYNALKAGADFAEMARKYSQDPGSAAKGGKLGMVGPGSTVKEFEEAAYTLQKGQISTPVWSNFGYHIIKMDEREPFGSYDRRRDEIIAALKQQGIDEASAEYRIKKMVDASNGTLTRDKILDGVLAEHENENLELKYLVQEYHDGLLLYEISKRDVWDKVKADSVALEQYYKKNRKHFAWDKPHFRGFVFHAQDASLDKTVKKVLKQHAEGDWRKAIKNTVNKDSLTVLVTGPYLVQQGENVYIDHLVFGGKAPRTAPKYPHFNVQGKIMKQPKSYKDVRAQVEEEVQAVREKEWVEKLRKKYTYEVDDAVVKTVNKHK